MSVRWRLGWVLAEASRLREAGFEEAGLIRELVRLVWSLSVPGCAVSD